jgi:hypothetical protein
MVPISAAKAEPERRRGDRRHQRSISRSTDKPIILATKILLNYRATAA